MDPREEEKRRRSMPLALRSGVLASSFLLCASNDPWWPAARGWQWWVQQLFGWLFPSCYGSFESESDLRLVARFEELPRRISRLIAAAAGRFGIAMSLASRTAASPRTVIGKRSEQIVRQKNHSIFHGYCRIPFRWKPF